MDDEELKDDALDGLQGEVDDYSASQIPSIRIEISMPKKADDKEDEESDPLGK